jgi:hypothetical protein
MFIGFFGFENLHLVLNAPKAHSSVQNSTEEFEPPSTAIWNSEGIILCCKSNRDNNCFNANLRRSTELRIQSLSAKHNPVEDLINYGHHKLVSLAIDHSNATISS